MIVLEIPAGIANPYHTQEEDYYIHAGSTSREELSGLIQDSGLVHYETTPIPHTRLTDSDRHRLLEYFLNLQPVHLDIDDQEEKARK